MEERLVVEHSGGRGRPSKGSLLLSVAYVLVALVLVTLFIAPIIWSVVRSLEPPGLVTSAPSLRDFTHATLYNYNALVTSVHILRYVANSAAVVGGTVLVTIVGAGLAGYGFSKFAFRGRDALFVVMLASIMIPSQAIITPLFVETSLVHLSNTRVGLILVYSTLNMPFALFIMRNSFASIPREIDEAGRMDGAGTFSLLLRVYRPLISPGIATVVLFTGLAAWTEFFIALIFLTNSQLYTLPVALLDVETGVFVNQVNYALLDAGAVIAMLPALAVFFLLQRYYVQGLLNGSVLG